MLFHKYKIPAFLSILIIAVYFKIIFFDFVYWDDDKQILNNNYVKFLSSENIFHNFKFERFTFVPLTLYSVLYNLFGEKSYIFHLLSILFHIFNVFIFYSFIKKITENADVIKFSTFLFALHPLRIESIAWISEWKDLLFTMFALLALINYLSLIKTKKSKYLLLYIVFCWLSGYSKIQGMLVPFTATLIDFLFFRYVVYERIILNIIVFALVLLSFEKYYALLLFLGALIVYNVFKNSSVLKIKKINISAKHSFFISFFLITLLIAYMFITKKIWFWEHNLLDNIEKRIFYFFYSLSFYIKQFFLPIKQIPVHGYPVNFNKFFNENIITVFIILSVFVLIIIIILKYTYEKRIVIFGLLFFLFNISIVLHIIPIEGRLIVAERYTYFAYMGLFIITSEFYRLLKERLKNFILYSIALVFSVLIFFRIDVWKNTETLFYSVIKKNPATSFAWNNLGSYYIQKKKPERAIKMFEEAIKIDSSNAETYFNIAMAYGTLKDYYKAILLLNMAIKKSQYKEEKSFYLTTIGQIYENKGEIEKAIKYYDLSLIIYPENTKALLQKAFFYLNTNKTDSAEIFANKILKINKYYSEAYNVLGFIELKQRKNFNKAIEYFNLLIEYNKLYAPGYNNRGYAYLVINNYNKAIKDFTKAIELDSTFYEAYRNRALTYFLLKNYTKAISDYSVIINNNKNDTMVLFNRAFSYVQIGILDSAINDYLRILKFKDDTIITFELAKCYIKAKNYNMANYYFSILEKKLKNNVLLKVYRGISLFYLNKIDSALIYFNQASNSNYNKGEIYFWIGECYRLKNDLKTACENYNISYHYGFKDVDQNIVKYCKKFANSDNFQ